MKFTVSLRGIHKWFNGEIAPALDVAQAADEAGMHALTVVDHILMGEDLSGYPYGKTQFDPDYPWWDPVTLLASISARTKRIRLGTSVIVSPLRPAAILAKQFTTLDRLSGGRIDAGLGVGWQKAEYDACGVPFENRFAQMDEQMTAMKLLWTQSPATYHGKYINFDRVFQRPFPVQKGGIPIWLGVSDTDRSLARVAEFANGWGPPSNDATKLEPALEKLRGLLKQRGRDAKAVQTRVVMPFERSASGLGDLDASLKHMPKFEKLGIDTMEIAAELFCTGMKDLDGFLKTLKSAS